MTLSYFLFPQKQDAVGVLEHLFPALTEAYSLWLDLQHPRSREPVMKRDDDLIRGLMLTLEAAERPVTADTKIEGYSRDQVAYHLALILKAGFAEGAGPLYSSTGSDPTIPRSVLIKRLSPAGHDFIATIRDDGVWSKVKDRLAKAGGSASLEVISEVGASVAKQLLGLAT